MAAKTDKQVATTETAENSVLNGMIVSGNDQLPEHMQKETGAGNDNVTAADMLIPRLKLLQGLSPEVDSTKDQYVPGAEPGQYINANTHELAGEMYVINLYYEHVYGVFVKRKFGGGFKGSFYSQQEAEAAITQLASEDQELMEQMMEVVETGRHTLLQIDLKTGKLEPVVFDMTSTKLQTSRAWNTEIARRGGDRFSCVWKLTKQSKTNTKGSWFIPHFEFMGPLNDEMYQRAHEKYDQITGALESGKVSYGDEEA